MVGAEILRISINQQPGHMRVLTDDGGGGEDEKATTQSAHIASLSERM